MGDEGLKTGNRNVTGTMISIIDRETSKMPTVVLPPREGIVQVSRIDNEEATLPQSLPDPSCMDVIQGVTDIPSLGAPSTNHDDSGEHGRAHAHDLIEQLKETVLHVIHDPLAGVTDGTLALVVDSEEVIERPNTDEDTISDGVFMMPSSDTIKEASKVLNLSSTLSFQGKDLVLLRLQEVVGKIDIRPLVFLADA